MLRPWIDRTRTDGEWCLRRVHGCVAGLALLAALVLAAPALGQEIQFQSAALSSGAASTTGGGGAYANVGLLVSGAKPVFQVGLVPVIEFGRCIHDLRADGDLDHDLVDFAMFANCFSDLGPAEFLCCRQDFIYDKKVDLEDFRNFRFCRRDFDGGCDRSRVPSCDGVCDPACDGMLDCDCYHDCESNCDPDCDCDPDATCESPRDCQCDNACQWCVRLGVCGPADNGDIRADGDIDLRDIAVFGGCFSGSQVAEAHCCTQDGDGNGKVDGLDGAILLSRLTGPR